MGMEGKLRQVSGTELNTYRKNPEKLYSDVVQRANPPEVQQFIAKMMELQTSAVVKRIEERASAGLAPHPADSEAYREQMNALITENREAITGQESMHIGRSKNGQELSLHKSWHCLHYILTGKSWEPVDSTLGKAILGGEEIPDRQGVMGYGPVRFLAAEEVREIAEALEAFPIDERLAAFDPEEAHKAKVYVPGHEADELKGYFDVLRDFYGEAAKKKCGMLLWVV
jgi:Domain of unknown function (DUF1877)